jgi:hypothetical protein
VSRTKKSAASERGCAEFSRRDKIHDSAETLHSSAFLRCIQFCVEKRVREKFVVAAARARCSRASAANAGRASYTQNLVE